ncbi:hypothetical protein TRFO_27321 [Tritrichomonas foetus]|uniref:Uncharacterized protein n=1 Tax=Tritrichomonas foetus TaxID=1144522 RepID=A0A1J4K5R0_9EUKA|nr:hypothetical protein TRFO_27321 [Tritrichomonas foetus]|eukprot:OHT05014.1 hypothetical protein TRFO_27321 [Tritrichomonas foetus]
MVEIVEIKFRISVVTFSEIYTLTHNSIIILMALVKDTASVFNSSTIENNFKIAQVLQIRKEPERALNKYKDVCLSLEKISRNNPGTNLELHFLPLSLGKISEIYKEKNDPEKALAFLVCQRHFFEYMAANRPNHEHENSTDGADGKDLEEHTLEELFEEMHNAFNKEDAPPPRDPQEVVKLFLEAKKKQDEEIAKENMKRLTEMIEERKRKLENSKWEQTLEWINNHPIKLAIGAVVFLGIFLIIALNSFNFDDLDPGRELKKLRDQAAEKQKAKQAQGPQNKNEHSHAHSHNHAHDKPLSQEELKQFQEMVEKLKKEHEEKEMQMKKARNEL